MEARVTLDYEELCFTLHALRKRQAVLRAEWRAIPLQASPAAANIRHELGGLAHAVSKVETAADRLQDKLEERARLENRRA